jgi:hypothetical protein
VTTIQNNAFAGLPISSFTISASIRQNLRSQTDQAERCPGRAFKEQNNKKELSDKQCICNVGIWGCAITGGPAFITKRRYQKPKARFKGGQNLLNYQNWTFIKKAGSGQ